MGDSKTPSKTPQNSISSITSSARGSSSSLIKPSASTSPTSSKYPTKVPTASPTTSPTMTTATPAPTKKRGKSGSNVLRSGFLFQNADECKDYIHALFVFCGIIGLLITCCLVSGFYAYWNKKEADKITDQAISTAKQLRKALLINNANYTFGENATISQQQQIQQQLWAQSQPIGYQTVVHRISDYQQSLPMPNLQQQRKSYSLVSPGLESFVLRGSLVNKVMSEDFAMYDYDGSKNTEEKNCALAFSKNSESYHGQFDRIDGDTIELSANNTCIKILDGVDDDEKLDIAAQGDSLPSSSISFSSMYDQSKDKGLNFTNKTKTGEISTSVSECFKIT